MALQTAILRQKRDLEEEIVSFLNKKRKFYEKQINLKELGSSAQEGIILLCARIDKGA